MFKIILLSCCFFVICDGVCPHGKIEKAVKEKDQKSIVFKHNTLRTMVLNGKLPNQPAAKKMPKLKWDKKLATAAQKIANTCVYGHVVVNDSRWAVGQNIYLSESTLNQKGPDWNHVVQDWFDEYKIYKFPTINHETGHYTQIVWANTKLVGCGYAYFKANASLPYQKFYVCNYGPAGNIIGMAPYETVKGKQKQKTDQKQKTEHKHKTEQKQKTDHKHKTEQKQKTDHKHKTEQKLKTEHKQKPVQKTEQKLKTDQKQQTTMPKQKKTS